MLMGNQQLRKGEYIMNNLEKRIKEIFPKENIKVLNFSTMKNPASIQCLNSNQIYNLKRPENIVIKNKK